MMREAELNQKNILLADDNIEVRSAIEDFLIDIGHRVIAVGDGKKALDIFDQNRKQLSLIITDIFMPVLDGFSLIRHVRRYDKDLPIMAITGCPDHSINTTQNVLVKHNIPLFYKPLNLDDFEAHLTSAIGHA